MTTEKAPEFVVHFKKPVLAPVMGKDGSPTGSKKLVREVRGFASSYAAKAFVKRLGVDAIVQAV